MGGGLHRPLWVYIPPWESIASVHARLGQLQGAQQMLEQLRENFKKMSFKHGKDRPTLFVDLWF